MASTSMIPGHIAMVVVLAATVSSCVTTVECVRPKVDQSRGIEATSDTHARQGQDATQASARVRLFVTAYTREAAANPGRAVRRDATFVGRVSIAADFWLDAKRGPGGPRINAMVTIEVEVGRTAASLYFTGMSGPDLRKLRGSTQPLAE